MAKKVIGFNSEDDFDRMSKSVRKSENTPQVGQRQRAKYPVGGGIKVERAVITEVGASGIYKAFIITGGYTNSLTSPVGTSIISSTEVYVGDHILNDIEAGELVMVAKVSGKWWVVESKGDCHGGCVDESLPDSVPGYIKNYLWHMPYIPCCPEASGTWVLGAVSESTDTTWESSTFQCNGTGATRKWIYDGTKVEIQPIPDGGIIQYRHEEGNKLCPTKMYAYSHPGSFPSNCGSFPSVVCMVPMCTRQSTDGICGGNVRRNWILAYSGSTPTGTDIDCGRFVSGAVYTMPFINSPLSLVNNNFVLSPESGGDAFGLSTPGLVIGDDPTSSTASYIQVTVADDYRLRSGTEFNCDGLNIFDLYNTTPDCSGMPETVYAFPADNEYISSYCCPTSGRPMWNSTWDGLSDTSGFWHCANIPYIIRVDFSTVANNSCSACDIFNDSYLLYLDQSTYGFARYRTYPVNLDNQTTCTGGGALTYYVVVDISTTAASNLLKIGSNTGGGGTVWATYTFDGTDMSDWNCKGSNAFTKSSESGYCTFPSTVTVNPCY